MESIADFKKPNFICSSDVAAKSVILITRFKKGKPLKTSFTFAVQLNSLLLRNRKLRAIDLVRENLVSIARTHKQKEIVGLEHKPRIVAKSLQQYEFSPDQVFIVCLSLKVFDFQIIDNMNISIEFIKDECYGILVLCGLFDDLEAYIKSQIISDLHELNMCESDTSQDSSIISTSDQVLNLSIDSTVHSSVTINEEESSMDEKSHLLEYSSSMDELCLNKSYEDFTRYNSKDQDSSNQHQFALHDDVLKGSPKLAEPYQVEYSNASSRNNEYSPFSQRENDYNYPLPQNNHICSPQRQNDYLCSPQRQNDHFCSPQRQNENIHSQNLQIDPQKSSNDRGQLLSESNNHDNEHNIFFDPSSSPNGKLTLNTNQSYKDDKEFLLEISNLRHNEQTTLGKTSSTEGFLENPVLSPVKPNNKSKTSMDAGSSLEGSPTKLKETFVPPKLRKTISRKSSANSFTFSNVADDDLNFAFIDSSAPSYIKQDKKFKFIRVGKVQKLVSMFEERIEAKPYRDTRETRDAHLSRPDSPVV